MEEEQIEKIFGAPGKGDVSKPGSYRFMDAQLLARPMRAEKGSASCVNVTTVEIMRQFLCDIQDLSGKTFNKVVPDLTFDSAAFLATEDFGVEGEDTGVLSAAQMSECAWMKDLIGDNFAFSKKMTDYDLPIIARNHLENGTSTTLWYEEFVPHGSVFFMVILTPEKECALTFDEPVQIGGNASIGYGYTKIEEIDISVLCRKEDNDENSKS